MPAVTNNWWNFVQAVEQKILSLTLAGISSENIKLQIVGDEKQFAALPGISVSPYGADILDPNAGGNAFDDPGYPVLVGIMDSKENIAALGVRPWLERWLLWRETLEANLHHKNGSNFTLNGSVIAGQGDTVVQPGSVINLDVWFTRQIAVGTFVVKVNQRRDHT